MDKRLTLILTLFTFLLILSSIYAVSRNASLDVRLQKIEKTISTNEYHYLNEAVHTIHRDPRILPSQHQNLHHNFQIALY